MKVDLWKAPLTDVDLADEREYYAKQRKVFQRLFCITFMMSVVIVVSCVASNELSVKDATSIFVPALLAAFIAAIAMVSSDAVNQKRHITILCVCVAIVCTCGLPDVMHLATWLSNGFGSIGGAIIGSACYFKIGCISKQEHDLRFLNDDLNIWMFSRADKYQLVDQYFDMMEKIGRKHFTYGEYDAVVEFEESLLRQESVVERQSVPLTGNSL